MAGPEKRSLRTLGMFTVPQAPLVPTLDTRVPYGPIEPPPPAPLAFLAPWLEGAVDLVRGGLWGSEGAADTVGAKAGELMSAALPLASLKGLGFFSRVDKAVDLIPAKGAHPNKVASLLKSNASAEELAYRNVPEFLAGKGNATVTRADLAAHLAAHPAPIPKVTTRQAQPPELLTARQAAGDRASAARRVAFDDPKDWLGVGQVVKSNAPWWAMEAAAGDARALRKLKDIPVDDDHLARLLDYGKARNEAVVLERQLEQVPAPKYHQYTVPGGEAYRETLLTLRKQQQESYGSFMDKMVNKYGEGFATESMTPVEQGMSQTLWREAQEYGHTGGRPDETAFRSGHFEEPNILVHTRANERTLPTGERGRFVEEVQSDWHQKGKKEGYAQPSANLTPETIQIRPTADQWLGVDPRSGREFAVGKGTVGSEQEAREYLARFINGMHTQADRAAVPDAPFKQAWPELGLKQQVLETAADPSAQWIGFTGGQTQADRYDLSKRFSEVHYSGTNLKAYDLNGEEVISQTGVSVKDLPYYLGEEGAASLLAQPKQGTLQSLTGVDLQVGGKGMKVFYDEILPKRLEKIVKPFGGTVERGTLGGRTKAQIDAEIDALMAKRPTDRPLTAAEHHQHERRYGALMEERQNATDADAWFAKLTPEMKARILKEGLPLLSLLPLGVLGNYGQQPAPEPAR